MRGGWWWGEQVKGGGRQGPGRRRKKKSASGKKKKKKKETRAPPPPNGLAHPHRQVRLEANLHAGACPRCGMWEGRGVPRQTEGEGGQGSELPLAVTGRESVSPSRALPLAFSHSPGGPLCKGSGITPRPRPPPPRQSVTGTFRHGGVHAARPAGRLSGRASLYVRPVAARAGRECVLPIGAPLSPRIGRSPTQCAMAGASGSLLAGACWSQHAKQAQPPPALRARRTKKKKGKRKRIHNSPAATRRPATRGATAPACRVESPPAEARMFMADMC